MEQANIKERFILLLYVAVGCIGAIGQAMFLHNDLANSYPYKMMTFSFFYRDIGEIGLVVAPTVAVALITVFATSKRYLIPAIPVLACPLAFLLIFEWFAWNAHYDAAEMTVQQFEGNTCRSAHLLFIQTSLKLSGVGVVIWLGFGMLLTLIENFLRGTNKGIR
jgi:hypothetical protein